MTDFFDAWVRDDRRIGEIPPGPGRGRAARHNERLPFLLVWDTAVDGRGRIRVRYRLLSAPPALALAAWYADRLDGRTLAGDDVVPPALDALRVLGLTREHAVEALMIEDTARESLTLARTRAEVNRDGRDDRHPLESRGPGAGRGAPCRTP